MRTLLLLSLAWGASGAIAQTPAAIPREKQLVEIEDLAAKGKQFEVDNIVMVKRSGVRGEWITWDADGTIYFVKANFTGEMSAMRISSIGMAAQGQIWYRHWPLALNRRGEVYAIDDSKKQDRLAKLEYWYKTPKGIAQAAAYGLAGGAALTVVGEIDRAMFSLFFDSTVSWWSRFGFSALGVGGGRALLDLAKSHRQLNRGFNFFTKRLVTNVERLEQVVHSDGTLDVKFIYRNGEPHGQPAYMSELTSRSAGPLFQQPDCMTFLEK